MTQDIRTAFDKAALTYDAGRRKLIPCFDDFYAAVAELADEALAEAPLVLDLGAGTGLVSAAVLAARPRATLVLADLSEAMLAVARERFAGGDVSFKVMDHLELDGEGQWDAIVSGLSIHHLDDDGKRQVYARAARALKPGGLFVNADQVAGDSDEMERRYWSHWHRAVRASGLEEAEIAAAIERQKLDRRTPLAPQLDWLRQAGLAEVECRYKAVSFAVMTGRKG